MVKLKNCETLMSKTSLSQLCVIVFCVFITCTKESNNSIVEIEFEKNIHNFHNFKLSKLCDNIEYIALESNDSTIFERIHFIDITDNYILIYDTKQCFLFDRSGRFLQNIGRKGHGPGEYRFVGQLRILNNEFFIPDPGRNTLMVFNNLNKFKEEIKTSDCFTNQRFIENYFVLSDSTFFIQIPNHNGVQKNRIALINRKGNVLKEYANTTFFQRDKPGATTMDYAANFYRYNGNIRYKELLNDTIWQVEDDRLKPVYVINRGKYGTPNYYRGLPLSKVGKRYRESIWIHKIFESKVYIIVKTSFMKNYPFDFYRNIGINELKIQYEIIGLFNKQSGEFFFIAPTQIKDQIEPTGIENDIDGGINFMPNYTVCDSLLLGWANAFELKQFVSSKAFKLSNPKYPEKKKELEQLANSLDENDNPVLMLVKLKE
jgi:hypothetical protein